MQDLATNACVLIVDDEECIRETLREAVEMAGFSAVLAANGVEALNVLSRRRPCLVLVDLVMPVMTGEELLARMRADPALADIPVVVCTSAPQWAPAGISVLAKPIDILALWERLRQSHG